MKVIVDTSVWSLALLRKKATTHPCVEKLSHLIITKSPIYLLGIILQEILQGVTNQKHFATLEKHLDPFPIITINRDNYIRAAQLHAKCRSKGIQISTIDALIATCTIDSECKLLTTDKDFEHIAKVVHLELL